MTVSQTRAAESQNQRRIDSGRRPDAEAMLSDALRPPVDREHARFLQVRELVQAGFRAATQVS